MLSEAGQLPHQIAGSDGQAGIPRSDTPAGLGRPAGSACDNEFPRSLRAVAAPLMELSYNWLIHGGLMYSGRAKFFTVPKMAYERLDEALRQLKTDRERVEATENQRKEAAAEARIRFARIKSGVIGPIFNEVVARVAAEGFFGETVDEQNDASAPISLNVNLSENEEFTRQGSLQVRFDPDKYTCELERRRWLKHHQQVK
jgi:hypothetical protein